MQTIDVLPHHVKEDVCHTRPSYREGKKPKGVKVYTCAQESKYLLVTNVPSISAQEELLKLFQIYGNILEHKMLDEYPCNEFCETILIKFEKIQNARIAKIKLDDYNFYGGSIHVCYAPEHETIEDVREKLNERRYIVNLKCTKYENMKFGTLNYDLMVKRFSTKLRKNKSNNNDKNKINNKSSTIRTNTDNNEENPLFSNPKLPDNWVKPTITGDDSYDQTVKNIRMQLKSTIPHQLETYEERKKKKKIQL